MSRTIAVVQPPAGMVGTKSNYARKLGGLSLLERVVRRLTDCERLDGVVVVVGDQPEHEVVFDLVPRDVAVFVSRRRDPLGRLCDALVHHQADAIVRVPADQPLVDPIFVDRLVATAAENELCDYVSYCSRDGRPTILSPLGVFAEWCRADALRRVDSSATAPRDREQPTRFLYSHPQAFHLRLIPVPAELDRDDLRLTVDHEEDWEHLHTIYDAVGPEGFDWRRIADLIHQHPGLRESMARLNREGAKVA